MIIAGYVTGFYGIAALGVFLLIPAALAKSKPTRSAPAPRQSPPPARVIPPVPTAFSPAAPAPAAQHGPPVFQMAPAHSAMSALPSGSSALFPTTMFPTLSLPMAAPAPQGVHEERKKDGDELLELGVLLIAMKLLSG